MGLLDDVLNKAAGVAPAQDASQNCLTSAALAMLASHSGGLAGFLQQFTAKGFGNLVNSWVSTGQNLPITPEQLQTALGPEQVEAIAAKAGISPQTAQTSLAQLLPQMVDHLTPNGQIPQGDFLAKGLDVLKGKLFS